MLMYGEIGNLVSKLKQRSDELKQVMLPISEESIAGGITSFRNVEI